MGVGNIEKMVKPWEWMKSAKKRVQNEKQREMRSYRIVERVAKGV